MLKELDVYLYGLTVLSTIHLLNGKYPEADSYAEIKESYNIPGGEAGNSAVILANLGCRVKLDGPFLGFETRDKILDFYQKYHIDCSNLHYDSGFEGIQDLVLVADQTRTVFGKFVKLFSGEKKWTVPDKEAITQARIVALDPFFGEESEMVAVYCKEADKRYVTIDCGYDSLLNQYAAATVISNEFIQNNYPDEVIQNLHRKYTEATAGLVIFTFGGREIIYGRRGEEVRSLIPYRVKVKSTLGAGDTFRAGVVYGLLNEFDNEKTVKFAAATAARVCSRFPMALNPPKLEEIMKLVNSDKD